MPNAKDKFTNYIRTVYKTVNNAKTFDKPIPMIPVLVRKREYELRNSLTRGYDGHNTGESRLIVLKGILTNLFRDERIEIPAHVAAAARPYAERLIQLASVYGDKHEPTMDVINYYMLEKELIHKVFKVYVPRFRDCKTAYTSVYRLPAEYVNFKTRKMCVFELKGNPYPPVIAKPEHHENSLLNVLLAEARKQYNAEKANNVKIS